MTRHGGEIGKKERQGIELKCARNPVTFQSLCSSTEMYFQKCVPSEEWLFAEKQSEIVVNGEERK